MVKRNCTKCDTVQLGDCLECQNEQLWSENKKLKDIADELAKVLQGLRDASHNSFDLIDNALAHYEAANSNQQEGE